MQQHLTFRDGYLHVFFAFSLCKQLEMLCWDTHLGGDYPISAFASGILTLDFLASTIEVALTRRVAPGELETPAVINTPLRHSQVLPVL